MISANERTPFLCNDDDDDNNNNKHHGSYRTTSKLSVLAVAAATVILVILSGSSPISNRGYGYGEEINSNSNNQNNNGLSRTWNGERGATDTTDDSANESSSTKTTEITQTTTTTMDFGEFLRKYGKSYELKEDYEYRKAIYDSNLETIRAHNQHNNNSKSGGWTMGINKFADLLPNEIHKGFDKGSPHGPKAHDSFESSRLFSSLVHTPSRWTQARSSSLLQTKLISFVAEHSETPASSSSSSSLRSSTSFDSRSLRTTTEPLPSSVDWRTHSFPVTTPVKDQGGCGSCWAFAATAVLESHAALATEKLFVLSPQELVSCAPNPNHCGGDGGCSGSTGELAYDYVSKRGMVTEWEYGYTSYHGTTGTCQLVTDDDDNVNDNDQPKSELDPPTSSYARGARVSLVGYASLPTNSYDALLYAVATMGPVVVSVAASGWGLYRGGIFDDSDDGSTTEQHYDINHAVVLEGYGTDASTGEDYWLVRNSWGVLWGEDGYIRLKRNGSSTAGDPNSSNRHCKTDSTPSHGVACEGPDGNATIPEQLVCGTSGILYANVVPVGAHLIGK